MNSLPVWELIRSSLTDDSPCALCIVVGKKGSGPGSIGSAMAVSGSDFSGTVGGGTMEHLMVSRARELLRDGMGSETVRYSLSDDGDQDTADELVPSGMTCSGQQTNLIIEISRDSLETIYGIIGILNRGGRTDFILTQGGISLVEPEMGSEFRFEAGRDDDWVFSGPIGFLDTVYIVGGGHVGKALARLLCRISFQPVVLDPRDPDPLLEEAGCKWLRTPYADAQDEIEEGEYSWAVIMTPRHSFDEDVLGKLCGMDLAYVGMMASGPKKEKVYASLLKKGISSGFLEKVDCPIGMGIGSRTPEEIAVSIAAELIRRRSARRREKGL